jgi:hypothetical protein
MGAIVYLSDFGPLEPGLPALVGHGRGRGLQRGIYYWALAVALPTSGSRR